MNEINSGSSLVDFLRLLKDEVINDISENLTVVDDVDPNEALLSGAEIALTWYLNVLESAVESLFEDEESCYQETVGLN